MKQRGDKMISSKRIAATLVIVAFVSHQGNPLTFLKINP